MGKECVSAVYTRLGRGDLVRMIVAVLVMPTRRTVLTRVFAFNYYCDP